MGNCLKTKIAINTEQFLHYNIIDEEYNIIVGVYQDSNKFTKSKMNIIQGICVGTNNDEINKIKLGIVYPHNKKIVELYFENNIKLVLTQENNNGIKMILRTNNIIVEKYIDMKIVEQYKIINNNSEYIDLIKNLA